MPYSGSGKNPYCMTIANGGGVPVVAPLAQSPGASTPGINLIGYVNKSSAVSSATFSPNWGSQTMYAGDAAMMVLTYTAGASIFISDTQGGTWNWLGSVTNGSFSETTFYRSGTYAPLTAADVITITITGTTSTLAVGLYDVPWGATLLTNTAGNSGSSAAPAVSQTEATGGSFMAVFGNSSLGNTTSTPSGWTAHEHLGAIPYADVYTQQQASAATPSATSSYGSSGPWAAILVPLTNPVTSYASGEQIPVVLDGITAYSTFVDAMWEDGTSVNNLVTTSLTFYNSSGTALSTVQASGVINGTGHTQFSTTPTIAPANTSYAVATVGHNMTTRVLQVFDASVQTSGNPSQPAIVNVNYAFTNGTDPWTAGNSTNLGWEFNPLTAADGNFDSLVIDNLIELMGGQPGVQSSIPELVEPVSGRGAIFRIPFTGGNVAVGAGTTGPYDLGTPQPTTDFVESLLLDGERPFGYRASNRTITIPVMIFAPSLATMAAAREMLMHTVDQQTWKLTWTPASSGLPMEFDCFRAQPSVVTYGFQNNAEAENSDWYANWAKTLVTLTFSALPYTHSGQDGTFKAIFANGTLDGGSYVPGIALENFFDAAPALTSTLLGFSTPTSATTTNIALGTGEQLGSTKLVVVQSLTNTINGCSDSQGNTYRINGNYYNAAVSMYVTVYICAGGTPLSTTDTVTVTASAPTSYLPYVMSLTGVGSQGAFSGIGTGGAQLWGGIRTVGWSTGTGVTASATATGLATHDRVIALSFSLNNAGDTPSGFTEILSSSGAGSGLSTMVNMSWADAGATSKTVTAPNMGTGASWGMVLLGITKQVNPQWTTNTAYAFGGSQSVRYQAPVPIRSPYAAATYSATIPVTNITKLTNLTTWFGQSYDTQWALDKNFVSNVTLSWTLTDINNHTLSFSGKLNKCAWGANPNQPAWTRINSSIPQGKAKTVFDYTKVVGYSVRITNWAGSGTTGYVRMHAWLSQISLNSTTTQWIATPHGTVYSVFGQSGMARTPISAEVQLPATNSISREFTKSDSWHIPRGVTSVFAEAIGGGGGGGSVANASGGIGAGGGGGAEYAAEPVISVIPGTFVPFTIGAGGTGGQVIAQSASFTRPGPNTWVCPTGVSVINVFVTGGGAAGGAGAGGGGGGAYTEGTVNVTAGKTYTFTVGAGGRPNTGKLSKDQAARHGGDSVVRGASGSIHAPGGSSPVTGGTNGGAGAPAWTTVEAGTTVTKKMKGGNGGNSPGAAGGGGGASGNTTANGLRGGDSPKGSNNYGTGGPGAAAVAGGGAGGKGADINGTPAPGGLGSGGGGGYTRTTNYNGAAGGNGKIVITYQENLGNPINGTATTFGATGLTNKILTAHGGSSPSINASDGAAGGTGSGNTTHFNGGKGSMSGNNNDYLFPDPAQASSFTTLANVTGTSASVTTGTAGNAQTTGIAIANIVSSNTMDAQAVVSDSAGNVYDYISSVLISGSVMLNEYAAKIGNPITTSTTLNVNNNGVSRTFEIQWMGSVYWADIDFATVLTAQGTSTTYGNAAITNADIGIHKGYLVVSANAAGSTSTSIAQPAGAAAAEYSSGSIVIDPIIMDVPGSGASAIRVTGTYASPTTYASVSIPLIPQDAAEPTLLKMGFAVGSGTTSAIPLTNAFPVPAGRGYMMLFCHFSGTPGTITFTDATGNTWSQLTTVTVGTSVFRVYTAKATNAYATTNTVTLNDTTSQTHTSVLYYAHEAQGIDASLTKTATGTSAAPAITLNSGASYNDFEAVIFVNNNSVGTTSTPSGWVSGEPAFGSTQHADLYMKRIHGRSTATVTSSYAASQTWGAVAFGFTNPVLSGSGGAAAGPLGTGQDGSDDGGSGWSGGGKGANGLTGSVGSGIDASIPGGGGSGAAASDTSDFQGGSGAAGMLRLTWQPPLTTFNDFILHRPGENTKNSLCPIISIPPNDPPDNREYAVPSLVPGVNAEFFGTYTVLVVANAWNSATAGSSRRLSVTINQYEYQHGPVVSVQATRVLTPATDIVNGYVTMGEVTLPIKDYDQANTQVYYTVSIHDTDQGDSFQDVLMLDTSGQTVLCNIAPGTAADGQYSSFFVNEPSNDRALGQVLGSQHGREVSVSVLDMTLLTGGPLYINAGENLLLAYSTSGVPNLGVLCSPRWLTDRTS